MIFLVSHLSFSQISNDTISYIPKQGEYMYTIQGHKLSFSQLKVLTSSYPKSYAYIKKAETNQILATLFSCAGGALIGWELGGACAGKDFDWVLPNIGAGLIAVSIPLRKWYNKNSLKAIELYNQQINQNKKDLSFLKKYELKFGFGSNGVGLTLSF